MRKSIKVRFEFRVKVRFTSNWNDMNPTNFSLDPLLYKIRTILKSLEYQRLSVQTDTTSPLCGHFIYFMHKRIKHLYLLVSVYFEALDLKDKYLKINTSWPCKIAKNARWKCCGYLLEYIFSLLHK